MYFRACARCKGTVILDESGDKPELACLMCGARPMPDVLPDTRKDSLEPGYKTNEELIRISWEQILVDKKRQLARRRAKARRLKESGLTVPEVAAQMKRSERTVARWLQQGA